MIRVLVAEDMHIVRGALVALLRLEPDIEVVAEVAGGIEILPAARAKQAQVAVIDIDLPGKDGLTAAGELHEQLPDCRTLILTSLGGRARCAGRWTPRWAGSCSRTRHRTSSPTRSAASDRPPHGRRRPGAGRVGHRGLPADRPASCEVLRMTAQGYGTRWRSPPGCTCPPGQSATT